MNFKDSYALLMYHHEQLKNLSIKHKSDSDVNGLEGNIYTYNGVTTAPFMISKMINIFDIAREEKKNILEIGFNAGNSALVFLMANPYIHLYAVDICIHSYIKPCVDYLNKHFNNRVTLYEGDSLSVVPTLKKLSKSIGIYHIDGWHAKKGITGDMKNCFELSENSSYVIVDDCNIPCIQEEYEKYMADGKIVDRVDKIISTVQNFPHRIAQYKK
jgi:predicted O-methyltransferase YrrM